MSDSLSTRAGDSRQVAASIMSMEQGWIVSLVDSRWFALADVAIVSISAALWTAQERDTAQLLDVGHLQVGGWPLVFAFMRWGIRLVVGRSPFRRTVLDFPIAILVRRAERTSHA